jgi:hypothetical protein
LVAAASWSPYLFLFVCFTSTYWATYQLSVCLHLLILIA